MTNAKSTKRALLTSVMALILCFTMLLGTTFAWFTDSVTSANNIIQSGNLDIELDYWNGTEWNTVEGADDIINGGLWEPGYTKVAYLRLRNAGSLALKYQLGVNILNEKEGINQEGQSFKLSDYIEFDVIEDINGENEAYASREDALAAVTDAKIISEGYTKADSLAANSEYVYLAMVVYMPTDVGNVANHNGTDVPQIDLGINVLATQMTAESDSFDDKYDVDADYVTEVGSADELASALALGGNIKLANDITTESGFLLGDAKDIVLNLNGHTLTATGDRTKLFSVGGDADMTIYGGKLVAQSTNGQVSGTGTSTGASTSVYFWSSGNLTMTNVDVEGSVRGGHRAIDVFSGNAVLTNVNITTSYGTGVNVGGNGDSQYAPAVAVLNDCDITVTGMYSTPYNSVCFSVINGGDLTINSGNYKLINDATYSTGDTHGGWVGIVMNSGGTLTTNGGTYTNVPADLSKLSNERAVIHADAASAIVNLNGGTFIPQKDAVIAGSGTVNGKLINNNDGTWTAVPTSVEVDSVEELLQAVENGQTAIIAEDTVITLDETVEIENPVVGKAVVVNNGTLNITGGTYKNGDTTSSSSAVIENHGVLNISGGEFGTDGNSGRAVSNIGGTVTISGGTFSAFNRNVHTSRAAYVFTSDGGTITIENGTSIGAPNGIFYASNGGEIIVNGGTFTKGAAANNYYLAHANGGTIKLNGGTYTFESSDECIWPFYDSIDGLKYNTTTQIYLDESCNVNWDRNK